MIAMLGTLLSSLFKKPATVGYPAGPKRTVPSARGHIEVDIDSCIFCGICRRKCPTEAIDVDKNEKTWAIEPLRCIQCNCCVESCPKKCLFMRAEPSPVATGMVKEVVRARVSDNAGDHPNG